MMHEVLVSIFYSKSRKILIFGHVVHSVDEIIL